MIQVVGVGDLIRKSTSSDLTAVSDAAAILKRTISLPTVRLPTTA